MRHTALVLGATGDLGGRIARRLQGLCSTLLVHGADEAGTTILAAELNALDQECTVVPVAADFTSLAAVRDLVRRCARVPGGLDCVVSAVDLPPPSSRELTEDGNEVTWQVNYLAPALVTLGLLPLLRNSSTGRLVQVVRESQRIGPPRATELADGRRYYPAWSYTEAKLALMMFGQTVAGRLRGSSARSLTIQPSGTEIGDLPAPLARGLMVDAVLYACTSAAVPNGAYLRGRRSYPLPRAAAGSAAQQRMWRTTCRTLALDVRTGSPLHPEHRAAVPVR